MQSHVVKKIPAGDQAKTNWKLKQTTLIVVGLVKYIEIVNFAFKHNDRCVENVQLSYIECVLET